MPPWSLNRHNSPQTRFGAIDHGDVITYQPIGQLRKARLRMSPAQRLKHEGWCGVNRIAPALCGRALVQLDWPCDATGSSEPTAATRLKIPQQIAKEFASEFVSLWAPRTMIKTFDFAEIARNVVWSVTLSNLTAVP